MDDDDHSPLSPRNYNPKARIILTAIISISFVVIIISIIHLYARRVLRRRGAAIQSAAINHTTEPPKTGLDPSVIASLPKFVFKQTNPDHNSNETEAECSVCLSLLEDGNVARTLPNCKHTFHAECIDQWLGSNLTCPICRTQAEPRLVPEPREGVEAQPSAPPLEGTSDGAKVSGSTSTRLSSFRRIISRERSSRRINHVQSCGQELEGYSDLERQ